MAKKKTKKADSATTKAKNYLKNVDEDYVLLEGDFSKSFDVLSTGSVILNKVLGCGGIPKGRITEVFGPPSSGKTTLATSLCIQAQKRGGTCLYLDFENAFDPVYAKNIGLDINRNKFALYQPSYFEKATSIITQSLARYKLVKSTGTKKAIPENEQGLWLDDKHTVGIGVPDIIVIDSIAAILAKKEYEGDNDSIGEIGLLPRLLSKYFRKLVNQIKDANTAVVLVNQERTNIRMGPFAAAGPDYETTGGKALKFYASVRLRLTLRKKEKGKVFNEIMGKYEELPIQNVVKCTAVKNKVGTPYRAGELVIRYGEGIDNIRSILDIAVNTNIINKGGAWFEYISTVSEENNFKLQGLEAVRSHIIENPDLIDEIQDRIEDHITQDSEQQTASDLEKLEDFELITEEYDDDGKRISD